MLFKWFHHIVKMDILFDYVLLLPPAILYANVLSIYSHPHNKVAVVIVLERRNGY